MALGHLRSESSMLSRMVRPRTFARCSMKQQAMKEWLVIAEGDICIRRMEWRCWRMEGRSELIPHRFMLMMASPRFRLIQSPLSPYGSSTPVYLYKTWYTFGFKHFMQFDDQAMTSAAFTETCLIDAGHCTAH